MSEETTDARPELTAEEQLHRTTLNDKAADVARLEAEEAAAEAQAEKEEEAEERRNRDHGYLEFRHMARSPRTKHLRAARATAARASSSVTAPAFAARASAATRA